MFLESLLSTLNRLPPAFMAVSIIMAVLFIGKIVYIFTSSRKPNLSDTSSTLALTGFIVGLSIALSCGVSNGEWKWNMWMTMAGGGLSILLMRLGIVIHDKLIMYGIDNTLEIEEKQNMAVAIAEACGCIATGFLVRGSLSVDSDIITDKFIFMFVYWALAQAILVGGCFLFTRVAGFNVLASIKEGLNGAAVVLSGFAIAFAMIIEAAITQSTTAFIGELPTILIYSLVGFVLLIIGKVSSRAIISNSISYLPLVPAALLSAAIMISIGNLFSGVVDPTVTPPEAIAPTAATATVPATTPSETK